VAFASHEIRPKYGLSSVGFGSRSACQQPAAGRIKWVTMLSADKTADWTKLLTDFQKKKW